jgi:hypothetical protein
MVIVLGSINGDAIMISMRELMEDGKSPAEVGTT